jgi:hypothetical protein
MRTIRITVAVVLALLVTVPAVAQEKKKARRSKLSPVAQAMMRMERLHDALKALDLSADQKEQLAKLHEDHGPKMEQLMKKVEAAVPEEQLAAAKAAAEKAKQEGKKGRAFFAAVEASITLNEEQKEKVNKVGEEMLAVQRATVRAVMGVLTTEQKEKIRAQMAPARSKKPAGKKKAE